MRAKRGSRGGEAAPPPVRTTRQARPREMPEFNRRLNILFLERRRPDGREYTCRQVVEAIEAKWRYKMSWTHLAHLKRGSATNPTRNVVIGLARFFGVPPSYLLDEEEQQAPPLDALTLQLLRTDHELLAFTTTVSRMSARQRAALFHAVQVFVEPGEQDSVQDSVGA